MRPSDTATAAADAVAIARRWFRAHDAVDYPGLETVLHTDVEVRSLFRERPARGRAEALEHFRAMMSRYPDLLLRTLAGPVAAPMADGSGTRVLASVMFTGHYVGEHSVSGVTDGRPLAVPGVVELHVADDHVRTVRTYFDKEEWLQQIYGTGPVG